MTPVVALVGRPNVGKSTLFNRLTRSRDALVANFPGLTRDRKYGKAEINGLEFIVIDTGGIDGSEEGIELQMAKQSYLAMQEADIIAFIVDARDGVLAGDNMIVEYARKIDKPTILVANKVDGIDADSACAEFYSLGFGEIYQIAAAHGMGVSSLLEDVLYPMLVKVKTSAPDFVPREEETSMDDVEEDERNNRVSFNFVGGLVPQFKEDLTYEYVPLKALKLQENVEVEQHGDEIMLSVFHNGVDLFLEFNSGDRLSGEDTCFYIKYIQELPYCSLPEDPSTLDIPPSEMEAEQLEPSEGDFEESDEPIKFAIVGRPNVGKSTLTNRMLGEERVIVYDFPGTTRDSIYIPMERDERKYVVIDTAGVRKRKKVTETVEKFSVIKTLKAIEDSHVTILLIDAHEGLTDQDLGLLSFILNAGRSIVIAINKWDGLKGEEKEKIKQELELRLGFVNFAKIHFISALHGTGVGHLFESIDEAYRSATRRISASRLTRLMMMATSDHQPPMVRSRRVKLKYAHAGGYNPPRIVIHGNMVNDLPESYKRYLTNYFRDALEIIGTPISLEFVEGENPFEGKVNKLTQSQMRKKRRMMKFVKSQERKKAMRKKKGY